MKKEIVTLVDEDDHVIGKKERSEVEKNALLHRSANVIIRNSQGKIFVHQRKKNKFAYPGMWDIKVGGLVRFGESYEETAKRELFEEAGIQATKLTPLLKEKYRSDVNNTNRQVFSYTWDGPVKIQKEEVEQGRFMTIEEIEKLKLSPTAKQVFEKCLKKNLKK